MSDFVTEFPPVVDPGKLARSVEHCDAVAPEILKGGGALVIDDDMDGALPGAEDDGNRDLGEMWGGIN